MAHPVDESAFDQPRPQRPPPANTKYPWNEWLNGQAWKLQRGADFDQPIRRFQKIAITRAGRRGVRIRTRTEGDTLYLQALLDT